MIFAGAFLPSLSIQRRLQRYTCACAARRGQPMSSCHQRNAVSSPSPTRECYTPIPKPYFRYQRSYGIKPETRGITFISTYPQDIVGERARPGAQLHQLHRCGPAGGHPLAEAPEPYQLTGTRRRS